jgi:murein DD-endopeptidase MepM/ murein hydrolase activator NlpD
VTAPGTRCRAFIAVVVAVLVETAGVGRSASSSTPSVCRSPLPSASASTAARNAGRAPASPQPTPVASAAEIDALGERLRVPIAGLAITAIYDTFSEARGEHTHEATDILAPVGTKVLAVDDGTVAKLFGSVPGGLTVYQFSADGTWSYYYAHLDAYAEGLHDGAAVRAGDVLGYVGTTGNAGATPHLHFAIFRLDAERRWWEGTPIDPYPLLRAAAQR